MSWPTQNAAFDFTIGLVSQANANIFQVNPTVVTGDFQISIDDGAFASLTNLPAATPAGSKLLKFSLTAAEMNGAKIVIVCSDVAGNEWADRIIELQTTVTDFDALSTFIAASDTVANVTLVTTTTNLTNGVTVTTNSDKTGYSISGTITTLDGLKDFDPAVDTVALVTTTSNVTNDVGITQAAADKAWNTTSRTLTDGIQSGVAFNDLNFSMVLSSDHVSPATGLTVTAQASKDGGSFSAIAGTISEISDGVYSVDLTAADTTATNSITYIFSAATADNTKVTIVF